MSPAAIATQTRIRQFSRDEDPAAAQVAAEIIGQVRLRACAVDHDHGQFFKSSFGFLGLRLCQRMPTTACSAQTLVSRRLTPSSIKLGLDMALTDVVLAADWYYLRWHAIAHNYQLSRSDIRMMYDLQGEAAAYAYWYPEEKGRVVWGAVMTIADQQGSSNSHHPGSVNDHVHARSRGCS
jgi:hypothetical protein